MLGILALAAHRGAWAVMDVVSGGFGRRIARAPEPEGRYLWQPSRVAAERVYFSSIFGEIRWQSARALYSTDARNPIPNFVQAEEGALERGCARFRGGGWEVPPVDRVRDRSGVRASGRR